MVTTLERHHYNLPRRPRPGRHHYGLLTRIADTEARRRIAADGIAYPANVLQLYVMALARMIIEEREGANK